MPKFYFTYGTSPTFPYRGGWTEITAPDQPSACTIHKMFHPSTGAPNCSDIYPEDQFWATGMLQDGNFGFGCVEEISLTREIIAKGGPDHA